MKLIELIKMAEDKSPSFKKKYHYWYVKKNRMPDTKWLLGELVLALGHDIVESAIKEKMMAKAMGEIKH